MTERERKREKPREVNGCKSFGGKVSQGSVGSAFCPFAHFVM